LRLLEIALGDVGSAAEDLPVGRDLDLDTRLGLPHRDESEVVEAGEGQRRTGLGEAIAFEDQDTGGVEELGDLLRERRAARYRETKAPADSLVPVGIHA